MVLRLILQINDNIQCDDTPNIGLGWYEDSYPYPEYKFALSRNLLKRWRPFDYGDFILVKGTKNKDGVYQVRDTMNPIANVDILESFDVRPYKYENVHIYKMNWTDNLTLINKNQQS